MALRLIARQCAVGEAFSSQQMLPLTTIFHRVYAAGDKDKIRELNTSMLQKLHLLRSREVAMILNHLAHMQVLDKPFWQTVSDRLEEVYVEFDGESLSITINAYARASLKHDAALQFLCAQALEIAARGKGYMGPRAISMFANAVSKLRLRDERLMKTLSDHAQAVAPRMDPSDLAMVENAYARLWMNDQQLFDVLEEHVMNAMPSFTVQHLAAIAHAYGRTLRRDEAVLQSIAKQLLERCQSSGEAISDQQLSTTMHAFATRLAFSNSDFRQVVEYSLPKVVQQMKTSDLVLSVIAAARIEGLAKTPRLWDPLFQHCLRNLSELHSNGMLNCFDLAAHLEYDSRDFWITALEHCVTMLEKSQFYEGGTISRLATTFAELWQGPEKPDGLVLSAELKTRVFTAVAVALLDLEGGECDLASLAELALALVRADFQHVPLQRRILAQATRLLSEFAIASKHRAGVADHHHARRLLVALCRTHGEDILEKNYHIGAAAKLVDFVPSAEELLPD